MHLKYTRSISVAHQGEDTQPSIIRTIHGVWSKIETGLTAEIATLRTLQRNEDEQRAKINKPTPGVASGVGNAMQFFRAHAQIEKAIVDSKAKIDNYRTWLRREGVTASKDGKVDVPLTAQKIFYDKDLKGQGLTRVTEEGGKLFIGSGDKRKLLDTADMVSHESGPGYAIYVMSAEGHIHVGSHVVGQYHHSSLLGGEDVAGAGELIVKRGAMKFVSNKSGHYRPKAKHFNQVLHVLDKMKQNQCTVTYWETEVVNGVEVAKRHSFASVTDYHNSWMPGEKSEYQFAKLMSHRAYIWNDNGDLNPKLAALGWRWADKANGELFGFYDKDGKAIDHKLARQVIKANPDAAVVDDSNDGEVELQGGPISLGYVDVGEPEEAAPDGLAAGAKYVEPELAAAPANYVDPEL